MADDLSQLETWCEPLLAKLQPGKRTQLARKIGQALRRSQHQRIVANKAPDGDSYLPRKRKPGATPIRAKKGRVKRKFIENGQHMVEIEQEARNQDDELSVVGGGVVVLPSRG